MISLTKALTSSAVTRAFAPEPRTRPRSTPSSRASLRTDGLACASPNDVGVGDTALRAGAEPRAGVALAPARAVALRRRRRRWARSRQSAAAAPLGCSTSNAIAGRDFAADRHLELEHAAGLRRRHVHARLLGLERHEPLLGRDVVAGLHENVDDLDAGEIAEIRNDDGARLAGRRRTGPPRQLRLQHRAIFFGSRVGSGRRGRLPAPAGSSVAITLPARDAVANLDLDAPRSLPAAGDGMSIVALSVSSVIEPLLCRHRVARLDENLDDLDVGKVTKIGYDDFHGVESCGGLLA